MAGSSGHWARSCALLVAVSGLGACGSPAETDARPDARERTDAPPVSDGSEATPDGPLAPPQPCGAGAIGEPGACVDIAGAMAGMRWVLPCGARTSETACETIEPLPKVITIGGTPGTVYELGVRFRGVVEQKTYEGGDADGLWQTGGTPADDVYNTYRIEISDPAQTYFLNAGESSIRHCWLLDLARTLEVSAGATITFTLDVGGDAREIINIDELGAPIVVPDVAPAPAAYDGQFVQVDVGAIAVRGNAD